MIWEYIEKKQKDESSKAYKILKKFKLITNSTSQLKKTKISVIFSLVIMAITVMAEADVFRNILMAFRTIKLDEIEICFRVFIYNIIPMS
uniref:Uncharacterized protein n=1 Tax=uncultured Desulfobacterium sp. TaxID=201089 RepID=E1YFD0_9BACT|nr:unknown protein [uncultured Desulfobacterium sp.]